MLRLLKVPLPLNSATLLQAKSFPETLIQVIDLLRVIPRSIQKYTNYPTCVQWPQNAGHRLGTVVSHEPVLPLHMEGPFPIAVGHSHGSHSQ